MADVLCNIDFAGNSAMVEQKAVSDGTLLKAPSTGANRWNNLISPNYTTWDTASPLQITDSDGGSVDYAITAGTGAVSVQTIVSTLANVDEICLRIW